MSKISFNYEDLGNNLLKTNKEISNVVIFNDKREILYQTENWNVSDDVDKLLDVWEKLDQQSVIFDSNKYSILQCTYERFIAVNYDEDIWLVGAKAPLNIYI